MKKIIFLLDLDAFFASVSQAQKPQYEGKCIAIGRSDSKSIVTAANYEARKFGVKSAMPIFIAKKLCPKLIVLNADYELYQKYSDAFFKILKKNYSNTIQIASIDECYLDVGNYLAKNNISPKELAIKIQHHVKKELNITVSIGCSYNKFLAKMACDLNKPNGFTHVNNLNMKELIWPLNIKEMYGVGKANEFRLLNLGINTIGDLANFKDFKKLEWVLNNQWKWFYQAANGVSDDNVDINKNEPISISTSKTFLLSTSTFEDLEKEILLLSNNIIFQLKQSNCIPKTIAVVIKDEKNKIVSKQRKITFSSYDKLFSEYIDLFSDNFYNKIVKNIALRVSNLVKINNDCITSKSEIIVNEINEEKNIDIVFLARNL